LSFWPAIKADGSEIKLELREAWKDIDKVAGRLEEYKKVYRIGTQNIKYRRRASWSIRTEWRWLHKKSRSRKADFLEPKI